ncbi:MAG: sugar transferase [Calditrichaeota bacterium]|nr:MAG: sugar transferase [Calditrichota bacterium]
MNAWKKTYPESEKESTGALAACSYGSLESFLVAPVPWWKRPLDLFGASIALVLLMPLFLLFYILVKILSPGPAFFKQERTGYLGKPFKIWKFRTMHANADSALHQQRCRNSILNDSELNKVENDPRIFPFGSFLRRSCIDELPQLFNVLRGEMSLVGPRPELPYAIDEYQRWHCARLNVLPGMTGLWQINGKNKTTFTEMIRYDIGYGKELSFKLEMKILLLTIPAIIKLTQ